MSPIAWNVCGLENPQALDKLWMIIQTFSPSLIFISETKAYGKAARMVKDIVGYGGGVHVDSEGLSGGLLLLWRKDWDIKLKS